VVSGAEGKDYFSITLLKYHKLHSLAGPSSSSAFRSTLASLCMPVTLFARPKRTFKGR